MKMLRTEIGNREEVGWREISSFETSWAVCRQAGCPALAGKWSLEFRRMVQGQKKDWGKAMDGL